MTTLASTLSSRRFQFWLAIFSALVLAGGGLAALVVFVGNTGKSVETPLSNRPAQVYRPQKNVPLPNEVRVVAGKFILTAVARRNLAESWNLVAPSLKRGYTLAQWKKGDIPVVPYPSIGLVTMKVDYSYPNEALLEVVILPKKGANIKPQLFFIGLHRFGKGGGGRWLVDYWLPRGAPHIPIASS